MPAVTNTPDPVGRKAASHGIAISTVIWFQCGGRLKCLRWYISVTSLGPTGVLDPRPLPEPVWELMVRGPLGHNSAQQPPPECLALVLEMETAHMGAR